ncbi:MAG: hypothetical protein JXX14_08355, partial [Deltaproteobacteria bacterium]|nr:hypothetical protein [Deltaproteobacteria bacterium]
RLAKEEARAEREAARQAEKEAREKEKAERLERQEAEREAKRLAAEQARAEREARRQAEREEKERANAERLARQKAEREEKERVKAERLAREKAEREEKERAKAERLAREKAEREEKKRAEAERKELERSWRQQASRRAVPELFQSSDVQGSDQQLVSQFRTLIEQALDEYKKPIPYGETTLQEQNPKRVTLQKVEQAASTAGNVSSQRLKALLLIQAGIQQADYTSIFSLFAKQEFVDSAFSILNQVPSIIRRVESAAQRKDLYDHLANAWRTLGQGALNGTQANNKFACEQNRSRFAELAVQEENRARQEARTQQTAQAQQAQSPQTTTMRLTQMDISISVPSDFTPLAEADAVQLPLRGPEPGVGIMISVAQPDASMGLNEIMELYIAGVVGNAGVQPIENKTIRVGGRFQGALRVIESTINATPAKLAIVVFQTNKWIYMLSYSAAKPKYDTYRGRFDAVVNSLVVH